MALPLMPKATAVWLIENTTLTFEQIADFCGMHPLEVQGIADGEVAIGIVGKSPVESGQITQAAIDACEKDPDKRLSLADDAHKYMSARVKGSRYTPVARRQDKPDAVAWLIKNYPMLTDAQIVRLIGTTKSTIQAIRSRTHWNSSNIKPKDPVMLGLCRQIDLEAAVKKAEKAAEAAANPKPKTSGRKRASARKGAAAKKSPVKQATPKKPTKKKPVKKPAKKAAAKKSAAKKPTSKKVPPRKTEKKTMTTKTTAKKPAAKKAPAKKPAAKKTAAKPAAAKKPAAKKAPAKKAAAKKPAAKKTAAKPAAAKKPAAKKAPAKKPAAKKTAAKPAAAKKPVAKSAAKKPAKSAGAKAK